jgi:hypothetical protein
MSYACFLILPILTRVGSLGRYLQVVGWGVAVIYGGGGDVLTLVSF